MSSAPIGENSVAPATVIIPPFPQTAYRSGHAYCRKSPRTTLHPRILLPRTRVNKPTVYAPDPSGWHHSHGVDLFEKRESARRRKLLCQRPKRTRLWSAVLWRHVPRRTSTPSKR